MYTSFFGLNDIPFSIAPNPDYLFLGDRHKEALAHLSYGLGDTGGFVLLTGEVGTGKTTISRRLLEQLPENTQVAFILNPTLSCVELLATICDELNVRYKKTGITLKYLTDKIQQKLLSNQEAGINTLLIIDEAQHLQPEVLEQLRLLTNLETNTKKLLQVVLIGQPELQQLLQRRDLRQLAQRITARYHLLPLTRKEVALYIKHRLTVADCHRQLFKPSAIALIHKISKGIPRLINLLCDRALATAYGNNDSVVNRKTVLTASEQALGSEFHLTPWWQKKSLIGLSIAANLAIVVAGAYWFGGYYQRHTTEVVLAAPEQSQTGQIHTEQSHLAKDSKAQDKLEQASLGHNNLGQNSLGQNNLGEANLAQANSSQSNNLQAELDVSSAPTANQVAEPMTEPNINSSTNVSTAAQPSPIEQASLTTQANTDNEGVRQPESSGNAAQSAANSPTQQAPKNAPAPNLDFDLSQLEGVSPELLAKLQEAVDDTNAAGEELGGYEKDPASTQQPVPSLLDMPSHIQNQVPALAFEVHIFATDGNGWVRVNGRERYEGDVVAGRVVLAKINQEDVVLELDGQQFSLPALSTW
ncbi:general secretion pathway protein GspA [Thalassotalea euphylliae]|uniref:General secretion pathway protein GspA n=1 Tax=Thalassotalea euphylliae TaxID=1655234 RepID=A0A3E0TU41_9GAMM|nr:AAA family ATPase [Thalassotalea euphylliae]REL27970.1 general secretion pathway protein GspA [Thalassotalea euphylliae]